MPKRKRLTNKQKKFNAEIKKEMQEQGLIPPDKPKLNRKKYVEEAIQEWNIAGGSYFERDIYLNRAIGIMIGKTDKNFRVSLEAVGVAKCLKLANRLKEFHDKLKAEGRSKYTVKEQLEYIRDILDA